jgi:phytoene dehydrogenase-like protein
METDVVVVGAGLAGLIAAQLVQRAGLQVRVVDARPPGGRARSTNRGGFTFNLGPRAVYLGGHAERLFADLGCPLTGGSPAISTLKFLDDGLLHTAPASGLGVLTTKALSLAEKVRFAKLMAGMSRRIPHKFAHLTVDEWLETEGLYGRTRGVLKAFVRLATYCDNTNLLSADVAIASLQASSKGVRYVDGGWQSLVDHLANGLAITRSDALRIEPEQSSVNVVLGSGETICTRTVIVAVQSIRQANHLMGLDLPAGGPSIEAACLTVGLTEPPVHPFVLGLADPFYLSAHSPAARLSDTGCVVHVMKYLHQNEKHEAETTKSELLRVLQHAGVDAKSVVRQEYLHRMTVTSLLPTPASGGLAGRPAVTAFEAQGVFLAGDWVGNTGFLLEAASSSAAAAAEAVIRRKKLRNHAVNQRCS